MIKDYFKIEKNPKKGLLALEWVMLAYMILTVATMLFTYTKLVNPESMIWGRIRVLVMTGALWGVYRMVPCRATKLVRVAAQMALLAWWYPDTYEINRMFPQPRPRVRRMGTATFRLPAFTPFLQSPALGCGKRTDGYGLFHVLSDDSSRRILLFLLQIQGV